MDNIFFDSTESLIRSIVITVLAYVCLIFLLRISGKRTLSKMNAFDFIVTIALGSCLATVSLNKNVALIDGVTVFALLIGLQFLITKLSTKFDAIRQAVTHKPTLLAYRGEILHAVLKKERITVEELMSAARSSGVTQRDQLAAVVLETTGDISVIKKIDYEAGIDTFDSITNYPLAENKK